MLQNDPMLSITLNYLTTIEPETYIIGGAVRNFLMGKPFFDIDITTKMRPNQIIDCFEGETLNTKGIAFGNVKVKTGGMDLSITTFRKDHYLNNHRYPQSIEFVDTLPEDLERRDFVVNTICFHSQRGIIDRLDGIKDIERMLLVCVKDPLISFDEDALRMVRALRFASEYDFDLPIELQHALLSKSRLLKKISYLQVRLEIARITRGPYYHKKKRQYPRLFRAIEQ